MEGSDSGTHSLSRTSSSSTGASLTLEGTPEVKHNYDAKTSEISERTWTFSEA